MSSDDTSTTELITFILAQQQQMQQQQPSQGRDGQAAIATAHETFPEPQMLPVDSPPLASNILRLDRLVGLLESSNNCAPNASRARTAAKAQANYDLLQSYLGNTQAQSPSTFQTNGTIAAAGEAQNRRSNDAPLPQYQAQPNQPARQQSHQELVLRAHEALNNKSQNMNAQQLEENLLTSINLLKEIDPNMVSVAAMIALCIPSSGSRVEEQSNAAQQLQQALFMTQQTQASTFTNHVTLPQKEQVEQFVPPQASSPIEYVTTPDEETVHGWSLEQLGELSIARYLVQCLPLTNYSSCINDRKTLRTTRTRLSSNTQTRIYRTSQHSSQSGEAQGKTNG
jgi:hypothetical protein